MWYYDLNGKPFGPVTKEIIVEEIRTGRIDQETLVWREGWPQWKQLYETELAEGASREGLNLSSRAAVNTRKQPKKITSEMLTKLFWWWFGLFLTGFICFSMSVLFNDQSWLTGTYYVFAIAGSIPQLILFYRMWQMLQDGFARTTPDRAVGFLFIPFFNFYWLFIAYYGLARNQNSYIKRHFSELPKEHIRTSHPGIALSYIISSLMVWFSKYFIDSILPGILENHSEKMLFSSMNITKLNQHLSPVFALLSIILTVFLFMMLFDLFLTAKSILRAESELKKES